MKIIGHDRQRLFLTEAIAKNRLHHSLLFTGKEGIGKSLIALEVASLLLETPFAKIHSHPDLYILKPEGKLGLHSIQTLRNFSNEVYLSPYKASKKVFIIEDAERMNPVAANALLKTFEEPSSHATIILLSSSTTELLPTILSRCQTVYFNALSHDELVKILKDQWNIDSEIIDKIAFLSEGSLSFAKKLLDEEFISLQTEFLEIVKSIPQTDKVKLREAIHLFSDHFEARREKNEKLLWKGREVIFKESSALTQESIEKTIEGELALNTLIDFKYLLKLYLSWIRDLSLYSIYPKDTHLIHKSKLNDIQEHTRYFTQTGKTLSYPIIESYVHDAILGFERQLKLSTCVETLFLKTY